MFDRLECHPQSIISASNFISQLYGDDIGLDSDVMEQVQTIVNETNWSEMNIDAARAERNSMCELLQIPVPKVVECSPK